jgi:hypothetical protein
LIAGLEDLATKSQRKSRDAYGQVYADLPRHRQRLQHDSPPRSSDKDICTNPDTECDIATRADEIPGQRSPAKSACPRDHSPSQHASCGDAEIKSKTGDASIVTLHTAASPWIEATIHALPRSDYQTNAGGQSASEHPDSLALLRLR